MSKNWYFNIGKGLLYNIKHLYYIKISNNIIKEFLEYMTIDEFEKGQRLSEKFNELCRQKCIWENAYNFYQIKVSVCRQGFLEDILIDTSFLNFKDIKLLALDKINERIEEVQKEFDSL